MISHAHYCDLILFYYSDRSGADNAAHVAAGGQGGSVLHVRQGHHLCHRHVLELFLPQNILGAALTFTQKSP